MQTATITIHVILEGADAEDTSGLLKDIEYAVNELELELQPIDKPITIETTCKQPL